MSVVTLFFTDSHGETTRVQSDPGNSLMRAAVDSGIDAIEAVCGGNAQCATCHVYVDPTQLGLLPPLRDAENETLDETAAPRRSNSRLSCQIMLTSTLDGLRVELPDRQ